MHILILGAGAMGSLVGARLFKFHTRLSLLGANRDHMEAMRRRGLAIEELDGATSLSGPLPSYCDVSEVGEKADLVIVSVKGYATQRALVQARALFQPGALFLTLQNGVGNWERIAEEVGKDGVLAGTTSQGATLVSPGKIRHGGNGPTTIGEVAGPVTDRVRSVVELFRQAGFEAFANDEMERLIWEKLLVNVGINAITALTGMRNGGVAESAAAREIAGAAVAEALAVARAKGIRISEGMADRVFSVARATAANRSSMGQDIDRRKQTEIDSINGAIVRFANELGVNAPVNRTLALLIRIWEESFRGSPDRGGSCTTR